jgi:hypothetical protein
MRRMVGLTDAQLAVIVDAAKDLPLEKRDLFLRRVGAALSFRGDRRVTDSDVGYVAKLALAGLIQQRADSVA